MFSLLVRRDGLIDPPQMSHVDGHCHILPGIDDGPSDEGGSLAIARLLIQMGVNRVVATPHVISDLYPNTREHIVAAVESFQRVLNENRLPLEVVPGAEYYAEGDLLRRLKKEELLCNGPERFVLFESPVEQPPLVLEEIVFNLKSAGYTPLMAHVERYRYLQKDREYIEHLRRLGVRFQVNHPSFHLPRTSRRGEMARWLYVRGLVDVLGTDLHRATPWIQPANTRKSKRLFGLMGRT